MTDTKPKPKAPSPKKVGGVLTYAALQEALDSTFSGIGTTIYVFDQECGSAVLKGAGAMSVSLVELAKTNQSIRKSLNSMVTAGAWGGVIIAASNIALPIMAHHGILPEGFLGGDDGDNPLAEALGDLEVVAG